MGDIVKIRVLLGFALMIVVMVAGCTTSQDGEQEQIVSSEEGFPLTKMTGEEFKQLISREIDDLGNNDVIVTDVDGWDVSLWQVRNRSNRSVVTYRGLLTYSSGVNYYAGTAAGIWDYENNIFSCTALDSSWSGGHINYVMTFQGYNDDGYVTLRGPYYYLENPNRVNRIDAWVFEGGFPYINPGKQSTPKSREEIVDYLTRTEGRQEKLFPDE